MISLKVDNLEEPRWQSHKRFKIETVSYIEKFNKHFQIYLLPILLRGVLCSSIPFISLVKPAIIFVSVGPGFTAFTRI